MKNGLYKVSFKTQLGEGSGVVVLENGKIRGGDSRMFYTGTYNESASTFAGAVVTAKHSDVPGATSLFGHEGGVSMCIKGRSTDTSAEMTGMAREAPGVTFEAKLTLLSEI
jgi:T3SS negative regulator,GrlR